MKTAIKFDRVEIRIPGYRKNILIPKLIHWQKGSPYFAIQYEIKDDYELSIRQLFPWKSGKILFLSDRKDNPNGTIEDGELYIFDIKENGILQERNIEI